MKLLGEDHEFTKLIISHKGVDPEDAFSTVPYEKGFHFLWYLDRLVGREHFDKFIPHYFQTWAKKSLDSFEFKQTFLDFFNAYGNEEIKAKVAQIDWEGRFYTPGLPPKPEFDTSYVDTCLALAEKWKAEVGPRSFPLHGRFLADFLGRISCPSPRTRRRSQRTRRSSSSRRCRTSRPASARSARNCSVAPTAYAIPRTSSSSRHTMASACGLVIGRRSPASWSSWEAPDA